MNLPINPQRLLEDLRHLATFGKVDTGVHRPSLSPPDMASRRWLVERMAGAGLEAYIDGVGNVVGRSNRGGQALLIGSHTDSQPRGGWLDGSLGVVYGLEIARALRESGQSRGRSIDVVSFVDEEGTFLGCLGSRSFCGQITRLDSDRAVSRETGQPLADAIAAAGLSGRVVARLERDRHVAYLEAHIEQGRQLEIAGNRIGVVTAIVGIRQFEIRFSGEANHAGTTPMNLRRDAGVSLIEFAYRLHEAFKTIAGPKTVWTMGRVQFIPGTAAIIPGHAELTLQFRDPEVKVLEDFERKVEQMVISTNRNGPVEVSLNRVQQITPSVMDPALQDHLASAANVHAPGAWVRMASAAGHDAMILADQLPCAMLFVPSIGGISHDFAENTKEEDIILGCQVLAAAAAAILES